MEVMQVIGDIGIVGLIGALIWLIRLEGVVKRNTEKIEKLSSIEDQTQAQEVRIGQRDEEMKSIKHTLDELKERVSKVEDNQKSTGEMLARIDAKLDILMKAKGLD